MLNEVKVDRGKLLATLEENKAKHVAEFDEAAAAYRKEAEKELRKRASEVRDGETLSLHIDLPTPRSFEDEYDRAIAMVTWSTEGELVLDETDFKAFVLDDWVWRNQFAGTTQVYNNAPGRRR